MRNTWKKGFVLILSAVLMLSVPLSVSAEKQTYPDWMGELSDEVFLSEISIPGTHDSCSHHIFPSYFLQCQKSGIRKQLDNGYRYLDIRVAITEVEGVQKLKLIHSFGNCRKGKFWFSEKLYLEDVLADVYGFLEEHPTETVIFCVKPENEEDDEAEVAKLMEAAIRDNGSMWYTDNRIPRLEEVRGKVVYASRFQNHTLGLNFYWKDQGDKQAVDVPYSVSMINTGQRLWVQDRYKYNNELKWDAFVDDLQNCQSDEDTFSINFLSTSGSGTFNHPKQYAGVLNDKFMDYELPSDTCYGILVYDFANAEIAGKVIATNE